MSRIRPPRPLGLLRLPRLSRRRLGGAVAILGLLAGLAILVVPVDAVLRDEPLLRLAPFSPALTQGASVVDCGAPLGSLGRRSGGLSLYDLAQDHACRAAASRRVATAVAAGSVLGVLGLIGLSGGRHRRVAGA